MALCSGSQGLTREKKVLRRCSTGTGTQNSRTDIPLCLLLAVRPRPLHRRSPPSSMSAASLCLQSCSCTPRWVSTTTCNGGRPHRAVRCIECRRLWPHCIVCDALLDGDTRVGPWICLGMAAAQHDQFEGTGAQRMDESGAPSAPKPRLGVRGGPHPGAAHQRDCGRRRPILLRKNQTRDGPVTVKLHVTSS